MPRAAAMTSTIKVSSLGFTQLPTGEWKPPTNINWSAITGVACRVFPATEREIRNIWGEALEVDAIAWVLPGTVLLPAQVLTGGSGVAVPCQVTDASGHAVQYMAVRARDMANMYRLVAIALRRFTHG